MGLNEELRLEDTEKNLQCGTLFKLWSSLNAKRTNDEDESTIPIRMEGCCKCVFEWTSQEKSER